MLINSDCRYFLGDRPCKFHKEKGVLCQDCAFYSPVRFRILIVKLDAVGDVLRTTCILQGLKEKYPDSRITWLTMKDSLDIFKNNPDVDVVLEYSAESFLRIQIEEYDLVINLDAAPKSARLAEVARGKVKLGFGYNPRGYVYPFNKEAERWFEMGIFDNIKKANRDTYQSIMLGICGLTPKSYDIILNLTDEEKGFGLDFARNNNIPANKPVIGLNTGAGSRWMKKKWTLQGYLELIDLLIKEFSATVLLFGGPLEAERNRYLKDNSTGLVIDTGCGNTLREFASKVALCDVLVTGDTLALHIGIALKKKIVALFGPTSSHEIDLYGRGVNISPALDCICCYKQDCDVKPDCMESIKAVDVLDAVGFVLNGKRKV